MESVSPRSQLRRLLKDKLPSFKVLTFTSAHLINSGEGKSGILVAVKNRDSSRIAYELLFVTASVQEASVNIVWKSDLLSDSDFRLNQTDTDQYIYSDNVGCTLFLRDIAYLSLYRTKRQPSACLVSRKLQDWPISSMKI